MFPMDRNNLELLFSKFLVAGKKSFSTEKKKAICYLEARSFQNFSRNAQCTNFPRNPQRFGKYPPRGNQIDTNRTFALFKEKHMTTVVPLLNLCL